MLCAGPGGAGSGEVTSVMGGESGTPAGAPGHHPPTRRLGRHVPCKDSRSLPFEATRPVPLRRTMPMASRRAGRVNGIGGAPAAHRTGARRAAQHAVRQGLPRRVVVLVAVLHGWATVTLGHHTSSRLVQPKYGMASRSISFQFRPA